MPNRRIRWTRDWGQLRTIIANVPLVALALPQLAFSMIRATVRTMILLLACLPEKAIVAEAEERVLDIGGLNAMPVVVAVIRASACCKVASQPGISWITLAQKRRFTRAHPAVVAIRVAGVLFTAVSLPETDVASTMRPIARPMTVAWNISDRPWTKEDFTTVIATVAVLARTHSKMALSIPHTFRQRRVRRGARHRSCAVITTPAIEALANAIEANPISTESCRCADFLGT